MVRSVVRERRSVKLQDVIHKKVSSQGLNRKYDPSWVANHESHSLEYRSKPISLLEKRAALWTNENNAPKKVLQ